MKRIPAVVLLVSGCVAAVEPAPVVTRVTWSTPAATATFIDAVNHKRVQVLSAGEITRVRAYGTVYYSDDLRQARGWIAKSEDGYLLCFHAPPEPEPSEPGVAMAAAASPSAFDFQVRGLPAGVRLRFDESCEPGARAHADTKGTPG